MDADAFARYARQILLPEIGVDGQERILTARAAVASEARGVEHVVAERYARRAGFARIDRGSVEVEQLAPAGVVERPAPRAVLAGARAVLREIRKVTHER